MVFAHDTREALTAAVALVNSGAEPDTLTTLAELDAFFEAHQYTGSRRRDETELRAVRALREPLRELLTSERDEAVAIVNEMLRDAEALPQLVRHDSHDWHVHAVAPLAPLATRIVVETAMAMVDVIRADEVSRLAVCADEECSGVSLDLSRNRSRRFCSTVCGNRNAVAAYRSRRSLG
ncbi:MAG: CGNR zinc finger domain-containing protein [Actinomycetota bacterium]|nr:CGNR zinc finger domain-containing protein [Actinomycetota bacterium]